jgi:ubiquinone biosynthesis protein
MYPQLDLWTTAQPFLEQWLKDRYSPKSIFKQFKRHVPDWLEHLPQIPPLIYQALQNMQQPEEKPETKPQSKQKASDKILNRMGIALAGIGIGLSSSQWLEVSNLPPASGLLLISLGLLLLLLR